MYFKLSQYVRIFFFKNPCHSAWQTHVLDLLTSLPLNMCDNLQAEGEVICYISIRDFTVCPTREPTPQSQEKWSCGSASPSDPLGAFFSWYEHIYHCTGWILGYKNTYLLPSLASISEILSCTIHRVFSRVLQHMKFSWPH